MIENKIERVEVIDSHTGGEPTRVVISGGPALTGRTMAEHRDDFAANHDRFRSAVVNEPRGSDVLVGALLLDPSDISCAAGVIFFTTVGCLGMCGHGTIGLITTLAHMGRIQPGSHRIETPVGIITAELHDSGEVSVQNVPCNRYAKQVAIELAGYGRITGDIAWGGNWFYLVEEHGQEISLANVTQLKAFTLQIKRALHAQGITGADGQEIDHIELFASSNLPGIHSKNFVLCPGGSYDRSPCGTGTSAKLACLYDDGKLRVGETWLQESVIGSVFAGSVAIIDGKTVPKIRGRAYINAEATLLLDPADPFCWGIGTNTTK